MKNIAKKVIVWILTKEAQLILLRYKPKIVAVTGSVGKTSTKDAIYTVLASQYKVRKSNKSFNSELGVPLTILDLPNEWNNSFGWIKNIFIGLVKIIKSPYPEWLVLEVGADRPGDIQSITTWLKPDVSVITRLSKIPVHVEFFDSPQQLFKEKGYLAEAVKDGGVLILNKDDDEVVKYKDRTTAKKAFYGFDPEATVSASNEKTLYDDKDMPTGITMKVNTQGSSVPIHIDGVLGHQHMYPVLAALAVAQEENINLVEAGQAFAHHISTAGRMKLISGIKESLIIDDSYNSSPIALQHALLTLKELSVKGKKIAVIGDMLELGRYSISQHKKAGEAAASVCDYLITVGVRARYIAEGALNAGMNEAHILQYENYERVGKELEPIIEVNDIILIKGSQSIRLEKVVEEIMAHPEDKEKLLVRQEEEWKKR